MKLQHLSCVLLLSLVAMSANAQAVAYNNRQWLSTNAMALKNLEISSLGKEFLFKPCLIEGDFIATKCKLVEYYDKAVYFDILKHTVIFVDDKARSDYYVIFTNATNVNMGANSYELVIECNVSPTKSYDVIYNVETNKARKVAEGDMTLMGRFATMKPQVFYTNPRDKNTIMLHDYFKALSEGNYVLAQEERKEICRQANATKGNDGMEINWNNLQLFNAYPLMELGEAMLLNYPADYKNRSEMRVTRDPYKAYSYVTQVYKRDTLLSHANAVLQSAAIRLSTDQIKSDIEKELLRLARYENTEAAFDKLLMTLYNSPIRKEARADQEALVYNSVSASNDQEVLLRYLNKYRGVNEDHFNTIEQKLFKVAYENMPQTEAACREYISKYFLSPYCDQVRSSMSEIAYNELKPTAASCKSFLDKFSDSPHAEEVWYKLYEYAFNELGDNIDSCYLYLDLYPNSEYCEQVDKKILKIKYDNAVSQNTVEAYDEFLNENGYNSYSTDIRNRRNQLLGITSDNSASSVTSTAIEYPFYDNEYSAPKKTSGSSSSSGKSKATSKTTTAKTSQPKTTTQPKSTSKPATSQPKSSGSAASEFERMLKGKKK